MLALAQGERVDLTWREEPIEFTADGQHLAREFHLTALNLMAWLAPISAGRTSRQRMGWDMPSPFRLRSGRIRAACASNCGRRWQIAPKLIHRHHDDRRTGRLFRVEGRGRAVHPGGGADAVENRSTRVYLVDGRLATLQERHASALAAASNWHALASFAGRLAPSGSGAADRRGLDNLRHHPAGGWRGGSDGQDRYRAAAERRTGLHGHRAKSGLRSPARSHIAAAFVRWCRRCSPTRATCIW